MELLAFTATESKTMTEEKKPLLIQIDGEVREMTPEEVTAHEEMVASHQPLSVPDPE